MGQRTCKMLTLCLLLYPIPVASYTYYRDAESCDLVGDSDVYGIGIRISIYIQSFTAIIGLLASGPEILHTLRFGFNAIATGIVLNFLKDIIQHNGYLYLEYWIIISLLEFILWIFNCISILMVGMQVAKEMQPLHDPQIAFSPLYHFLKQGDGRNAIEKFWVKFNRSIGHLGYFSITWTLLLSSILNVTRLWVYLDDSDYRLPPHCIPMINFYANIDIYAGSWDLFHLISSVLLLYTVSLTLLFSAFYFTFGLLTEFEKLGVYELPAESDVLPTSKKAKKWPARFFARFAGSYAFEMSFITPHLAYTILFRITSLPTTFAFSILYAVAGLFAFISGIVWTEGTIRVNNIDLSAATITSSGQLISLIVTIFTSIPIWWTMLLTLIAKWTKKWAKTQ